MKETPLTEGNAGIVDEVRSSVVTAPEIAFDRIVAACLELEWQIKPRISPRGGRVAREPENGESD